MFARAILVSLFLIFITAFTGLGFWQLDRAEQKRALFAAFDNSGGVTATELIDADAAIEQRYARLELKGRFISSRQILLDWLTYEGQVGYQVLTPFQVAGSDCCRVMVNRGWVAGSADHSVLPVVDVDENIRVIRGRIDTLPVPGLRTTADAVSPNEGWPRALLYPTVEQIEEVLGGAIAPYQLLLEPEQADGFVRVWRPRTLQPENHVGYAVQWFAMALALAGIGIGLLIRSKRHE